MGSRGCTFLEKIRYSISHLGAVAYIYEDKSHQILASVYHKKKLRRAVKEIAMSGIAVKWKKKFFFELYCSKNLEKSEKKIGAKIFVLGRTVPELA